MRRISRVLHSRTAVGNWGFSEFGNAASLCLGPTTAFQCVGQGVERFGEIGVTHRIEHGAALFLDGEDAGIAKEGEVPGDDGKVHGAAGGHLTDGLGAATTGEADEDVQAGGVGQGLEQPGVEAGFERAAASAPPAGGAANVRSAGRDPRLFLSGYLHIGAYMLI